MGTPYYTKTFEDDLTVHLCAEGLTDGASLRIMMDAVPPSEWTQDQMDTWWSFHKHPFLGTQAIRGPTDGWKVKALVTIPYDSVDAGEAAIAIEEIEPDNTGDVREIETAYLYNDVTTKMTYSDPTDVPILIHRAAGIIARTTRRGMGKVIVLNPEDAGLLVGTHTYYRPVMRDYVERGTLHVVYKGPVHNDYREFDAGAFWCPVLDDDSDGDYDCLFAMNRKHGDYVATISRA
jgi:hypothetical protein